MSKVADFFRGFGGEMDEGDYRDGPYFLPITGGMLSAEAGGFLNWWQMGYHVEKPGATAMAEACVSAYAQTLAMCPGDHWLLKDDGGRERQTQSALSRILRKPNSYQTISDFLLNAVRGLMFDGRSYSIALRNNRNEITELHQFHSRQSRPLIGEDGSVFYELSGNEIVQRMLGVDLLRVPARDVLHMRLHTPTHPLLGVSPITACAIQMATQNVALAQQLTFFANQSRPSFVLSTDQILTRPQVEELRQRWDEQATKLRQGGTPILTAGLKPSPVGMSAHDSQLAETMKLTDMAVAQVYRVPLVLVGIDKSPFASTEALMQFWMASGLGFVLNHVEEAFGQLFGLYGQPTEYVEFNTAALLRSARRDQIESLARAVQGGIYSPDEARNELEKPRVPGGHGSEPRVQQQVVPLSFAATQPAPKPPTPPMPPTGGPPNPADGQPPTDGQPPADGAPQAGRMIADGEERFAECCDEFDFGRASSAA